MTQKGLSSGFKTIVLKNITFRLQDSRFFQLLINEKFITKNLLCELYLDLNSFLLSQLYIFFNKMYLNY